MNEELVNKFRHLDFEYTKEEPIKELKKLNIRDKSKKLILNALNEWNIVQ